MISRSDENELLNKLGVGSKRIKLMSPSIMRRIARDYQNNPSRNNEYNTYDIDCQGSRLGDRIVSISIRDIVDGLLN